MTLPPGLAHPFARPLQPLAEPRARLALVVGVAKEGLDVAGTQRGEGVPERGREIGGDGRLLRARRFEPELAASRRLGGLAPPPGAAPHGADLPRGDAERPGQRVATGVELAGALEQAEQRTLRGV